MKTGVFGSIGAVVVFLATATVALAQAPTGPTYGGVGPAIDEEVGTTEVATGTLPFTGFDIALALGVGLLLVAIGVLTRRLGRTRA